MGTLLSLCLHGLGVLQAALQSSIIRSSANTLQEKSLRKCSFSGQEWSFYAFEQHCAALGYESACRTFCYRNTSVSNN